MPLKVNAHVSLFSVAKKYTKSTHVDAYLGEKRSGFLNIPFVKVRIAKVEITTLTYEDAYPYHPTFL